MIVFFDFLHNGFCFFPIDFYFFWVFSQELVVFKKLKFL